MTRVSYALVTHETKYPLQIGKNVVGRSSAPVEGVSFIHLPSPQAAISRMQAFLDIGANGDAWLCDCNSTNGTVLSIHPGPGVRLEANRYYQLTPGCRIVFGDVECVFDILDEALTPERQVNCGATPSFPSVRNTTTLPVMVGPSPRVGGSRDADQSPVAPAPHRCDVPYLQVNAAEPLEAAPPVKHKSVSHKSMRSNASALREPRTSAKRARREATRSLSPDRNCNANVQSSSEATASVVVKSLKAPSVCLTGMDCEERKVVEKRVRELRGRIVDDIKKASLLIVASPPVRTPKLIIAVARGIPIVSAPYICSKEATFDDAHRHIISLKAGSHNYTASALTKVIYREDRRPLLTGVRFNIAALPMKVKSVATEIITASGGEIVRAKRDDGLVVSEKTLDTLYDAVLRGRVPTEL